MRRVTNGLLVALALAAVAEPAGAQILKRAKERVQAELEKAVKCVVNDQACIDKAKKEGKTVVVTDEQGNPLPEDQTPAAQQKPGEGAWANYDFVPGDRVLYFDDFSQDVVGDFPRRMEFKQGAMEVVEWNDARWLRVTQDNSRFYVVLPEVLPDRFTMEFDYVIPGQGGNEVWVYFGESTVRQLQFTSRGAARVINGDTDIRAEGQYESEGDVNRIRRARILGDGRYLKVYLDDKRILNVPNADMERDTRIQFYTDAHVDDPSLFGNFRIAAGGLRIYDALSAEGRVATQGILFDTGSDRLRPESTPTLKEIGTMLTQHPDLCVLIEGHTDSVGDDASNLELSQRRATAVKQYLVETHSIDPIRLEAEGFGETRPVAGNDTAEGRQNNRRVELVELSGSN